ncbi:MAG: ThuA domain-containing protein [Bacteroidota bacterium]|nr:ThuA domain-containing protein [Bacteroidota bacterium]
MAAFRLPLLTLAMAVFLSACSDAQPVAHQSLDLPDVPHRVTWDGSEGPNADGPGAGKHIVFLSGDHEYRSEEILPAMARLMAWHQGFVTTTLFTLNDEGFIEPGSSNMRGLEVLKDADLVVMGLRFQDFPQEEMQHFVDYLERGGPILGIRTSTHAFANIEGPHERFNWNYQGDDWHLGFGRQVLGETWVRHYGTNHQQSSNLVIAEGMGSHPILTGIESFEAAGMPDGAPFAHVVSGGYWADPMQPSSVLVRGVVLDGMEKDATPDPEKDRVPVAWTRTYAGTGAGEASAAPARVFTTTHGASEDFLDPGFRRMMVNAAYWAMGMEDVISPDLGIDFVGPYHPAVFAFDGFRIGVRPSDMAGWDTPIMDPSKPVTQEGAGAQE